MILVKGEMKLLYKKTKKKKAKPELFFVWGQLALATSEAPSCLGHLPAGQGAFGRAEMFRGAKLGSVATWPLGLVGPFVAR